METRAASIPTERTAFSILAAQAGQSMPVTRYRVPWFTNSAAPSLMKFGLLAGLVDAYRAEYVVSSSQVHRYL